MDKEESLDNKAEKYLSLPDFSPLAQSYVFFGKETDELLEVARALAGKVKNGGIVFELNGETATVENVREFLQFLSLKPVGEGRQVGIISNAQELHASSLNSLLKTLEEPKTQALVFLLTTRWNLPETVISRCRVVRFASSAKQNEPLLQDGFSFLEIINSSSAKRLNLLLTFAEDSEQLEKYITKWLAELKVSKEVSKMLAFGPSLLEGLRRLKLNANKKLVSVFLARKLQNL